MEEKVAKAELLKAAFMADTPSAKVTTWLQQLKCFSRQRNSKKGHIK